MNIMKSSSSFELNMVVVFIFCLQSSLMIYETKRENQYLHPIFMGKGGGGCHDNRQGLQLMIILDQLALNL